MREPRGQPMKPAPLDASICPHPDDGAQIWDLLRDLHPHQGAALLLRVGFQLPQQTVAAVLGVPQDAVSQLCSPALRPHHARPSGTCPE